MPAELSQSEFRSHALGSERSEDSPGTDARGRTLATPALQAQIRRGFVGQRFEPALEQEFRRYLRATGRYSRITVTLLGIVATLLSILIDWMLLGMPPDNVLVSWYLRLGVEVPCLLIAMIALISWPRSIVSEWLLIVAMFATISCIMAQRVINSHYGFSIPLELTSGSILAMCTLGRVPFRRLAPASFIAYGAVILAELFYVMPSPETAYAVFSSAVIFGVAICAAYSTEYFIRWSWLNSALLRHIATFDGLTGLFNRAALDDAMSRVHAFIVREKRPCTLALIDIDVFGAYNEYFGHQAGDETLTRVAGVIGAGARRPSDIAGRYGGEEFVILWVDAQAGDGLTQAEAIRTAVQQLQIPAAPSSDHAWVSISIGLCSVPGEVRDVSLKSMIRNADTALYAAKSAGRNRVQQTQLEARPSVSAGSERSTESSARCR